MTAEETTDGINTVLRPNSVSQSVVYWWYQNFKFYKTSPDVAKSTDRPSVVTTEENIMELSCVRCRRLRRYQSREYTILSAILWTLGMSLSHGCTLILTEQQIEPWLNICSQNKKKFASEGTIPFSRLVIRHLFMTNCLQLKERFGSFKTRRYQSCLKNRCTSKR